MIQFEGTHPAYRTLLIITFIAAVGGLATLVPWPSATTANAIAYYSLCTFAPAATFFCFLIAGLSCTIRSAYFSRTAMAQGSTKRGITKHLPAFIVLIPLAIVASIFTVKHLDTEARFQDILKQRSHKSVDSRPSMSAAQTLIDGVYIGEAKQDAVIVMLRLIIQEQNIIALDLLSESQNISLRLHEALALEILGQQKAPVDAISGATLSAELWQDALIDGLKKARK